MFHKKNQFSLFVILSFRNNLCKSRECIIVNQSSIRAPYMINSLGTALFCCKFNLVDTDQFSCEYLVWVLCYCSQTDVLFPHRVGALAHTRDAEDAPPIAGVKPEMCCDFDIFR